MLFGMCAVAYLLEDRLLLRQIVGVLAHNFRLPLRKIGSRQLFLLNRGLIRGQELAGASCVTVQDRHGP